MEKRLIVLIDFSAYSGDLLKYAYDWSKKAGGNLVLVHHTTAVVPAMADDPTRVTLTRATNEEALAKLHKLKDEHLPDDANVRYIASEQPVESIISGLQAEPFDNLVFMGVKGTGRLKQIFVGSFVIEVIDRANSIVVAMPRNVTEFVSKKMYVAVSNAFQLNTEALDALLAFTAGKITELSFFSLTDSKFDLMQMESFLSRLVDQYNDRVKADYNLYAGEKVYDNIRDIINSRTDELLVVQRGSQSLAYQPFRKFIINELVFAGETPLVVLP